MLIRSLRFRERPVAAHLIPIRRCNLSCTYCNEYDDRSAPIPTAEVFRRIDRLVALGTGVITLSGGEPMLHPDLDQIISHIRRRGAIATLITNGYFLTRDRIARLNRAGLDHLQISIDNVQPYGVSKKSLKVLDQKLVSLSAVAEFDVTVNSVVGSGITRPEDALTVASRARELGFSTTVGIIHDGSGHLVKLDEMQRGILERVVALGKSAFDYANYNRFQKNLADGQPNEWQCRAGARYLYVCEDGLVHWCSQQRGHPGIPLDRYGVDFTPLTLANARGSVLSKYNVLIMPDGSAARYFSSLGAGGVSGLKTWINNGGTLITVRGASVFAALKDVGLTSSKLVGSDDDEDKGKATDDDADKKKDAEVKPSPTPRGTPSSNIAAEPVSTPEPKTDKQDWQAPVLPPIASPSASAGKVPEGIPGAIMRATVDRTTYLTYGIKNDELPVLLSSGYFFRYSKEGTNALVFDAKPKRPLTVSGFAWEGNTERLLKGTAYIIDEPTGSGHVILFAEEPFFRGIFRSTTRPFFNSILFSGVF